ncbi:hypothetical protein M426DRAFT_17422 [Hypoxylon sp. CI-4A]|nr:hypothetical protein M426DRAFT_17422 [Hypoxylon sp. CI-4A]
MRQFIQNPPAQVLVVRPGNHVAFAIHPVRVNPNFTTQLVMVWLLFLVFMFLMACMIFMLARENFYEREDERADDEEAPEAAARHFVVHLA